MRWLDGITDSMDMCLTNFGRWWRTRNLGMLQSMGSQRVRQDLVTEQQQKQKLSTPYPGATLTIWDGPHSVYRVCFSPNKSTTDLVLYLSLNPFCNETRIWASLNPETRCVISVGRSWDLARFKAWPYEFKSQSEANGFSMTLFPGYKGKKAHNYQYK